MPAPLGGIGQQVADNLFELGQSTVKAAANAGSDIVKNSFEQITGAPSGVGAPQADKPKDQGQIDRDRQKEMDKQEDKRRYNQVLQELDQFRQRKKQQDSQIAQERNQQDQEKQQKDAVEKQEKDSFVKRMLQKVGAGAHGETAKQKE
jgi:hypothetical protein